MSTSHHNKAVRTTANYTTLNSAFTANYTTLNSAFTANYTTLNSVNGLLPRLSGVLKQERYKTRKIIKAKQVWITREFLEFPSASPSWGLHPRQPFPRFALSGIPQELQATARMTRHFL
jgi:hypothetical protein